MQLNAGRKRHEPNSAPPDDRGFWTSGYWTPGLIALLCAALLLISYNHRQGNFHKLETAVMPKEQNLAAPIGMGPGGVAPVKLSRVANTEGEEPEFISMTMLPGREMMVQQITAYLPGHGESNLLRAPDTEDISKFLSYKGVDKDGANAELIGGAILQPFAGRVWGDADSQGKIPVTLPGSFRTDLPPSPSAGPNRSLLGLALGVSQIYFDMSKVRDGEDGSAVIASTSYPVPWPSTVYTTVKTELRSDSIEMTMTAANAGKVPTPIGLGWHPIFQLLGDHPEAVRLMVPSSVKLVTDAKGQPTGKETSVEHSAEDFTSADGTPLGTHVLDAHYVDLQRASTAEGPMIVLRDPEAGYGLRIILIDGDSNEVHVQSKPDQPFVAFTLGTNRDDPFGPEWKNGDSGIHMLAPGEFFTWKVRLEIFSLN